MAWLKLRLYHLDVLVCGATVATYFWKTEMLKLEDMQWQMKTWMEKMEEYEWDKAHSYSNPCRGPSPKVNPE